MVSLPSAKRPSSSAEVSSSRSFLKRAIATVKLTVSMVLVLFSVVVISTAIITKQTVATGQNNVHPILALAIFWISLLWLSILEGGLNCIVGLQPISPEFYKDTHPKTYKSTHIVSHKGRSIEHFIVGRQYLDLMIVFLTSFMVSAIDDASVLGLPKGINDIFLKSDLAVILCTIVFGQLIAQINCAHSMLDFINNWVMVASTYAALCVEASGILHAVYLVQIVFSKIVHSRHPLTATENTPWSSHTTNNDLNDAGDSSDETNPDTTRDSDEPTKSLLRRSFFWIRVLFSLCISIFAIVIFSTALINGNTTVREQIPVPLSFLSLLVLVILGGFMEALQIALFAVKHLPPEVIEADSTAKRNCDYVLGGVCNNNEGENEGEKEDSKLQAFLVGRQIAQTVIMFMIARIITVEMKNGETMFGVSSQIQTILFDSGLLNALVSTIFASLSWRVTANLFPMLYLGSPFSIWIIHLCLLVEGTGICDAAWPLAKIPAYLVGYSPDEEWLKRVETRSFVDLEKTGALSKEDSIVSATGASETTDGVDSESEGSLH